MESDNHIISHMTSYVIDLIQLRQFHIITHSKVDLSLIIRHLIYLTFLVNLHNQLFEPTFLINLFNQFILNWQYHWLVIAHLLSHEVYYSRVPLVALKMKSLLDTVRTSPLCRHQFCQCYSPDNRLSKSHAID